MYNIYTCMETCMYVQQAKKKTALDWIDRSKEKSPLSIYFRIINFQTPQALHQVQLDWGTWISQNRKSLRRDHAPFHKRANTLLSAFLAHRSSDIP